MWAPRVRYFSRIARGRSHALEGSPPRKRARWTLGGGDPRGSARFGRTCLLKSASLLGCRRLFCSHKALLQGNEQTYSQHHRSSLPTHPPTDPPTTHQQQHNRTTRHARVPWREEDYPCWAGPARVPSSFSVSASASSSSCPSPYRPFCSPPPAPWPPPAAAAAEGPMVC